MTLGIHDRTHHLPLVLETLHPTRDRREAPALGPVLLPPCIRQRPFAIAGLWQDVSLLVLAPQRGVAKAISSATRQLLARALLSNLTIPPALALPV